MHSVPWNKLTNFFASPYGARHHQTSPPWCKGGCQLHSVPLNKPTNFFASPCGTRHHQISPPWCRGGCQLHSASQFTTTSPPTMVLLPRLPVELWVVVHGYPCTSTDRSKLQCVSKAWYAFSNSWEVIQSMNLLFPDTAFVLEGCQRPSKL